MERGQEGVVSRRLPEHVIQSYRPSWLDVRGAMARATRENLRDDPLFRAGFTEFWRVPLEVVVAFVVGRMTVMFEL